MLIFPTEIKPLRKWSVQQEYRVKKSQFGGGFKQVKPLALNPVIQKINLEFIVQGDQIDTLLNFFEATKGSVPFVYQLSDRHQPSYFIHNSLSFSPERDDLWRFSVTLESFNQYAPPLNLLEIELSTGLIVN